MHLASCATGGHSYGPIVQTHVSEPCKRTGFDEIGVETESAGRCEYYGGEACGEAAHQMCIVGPAAANEKFYAPILAASFHLSSKAFDRQFR